MEKSLRIVMIHPHDIYSAKEPWTIRIIEIARKLTEFGHTVKLIYFPLPKNERGLLKSSKITEFETIPFSRRSLDLLLNIIKFKKYANWADVIHLQKCFPNAALPAVFGAYVYQKHLHYDWDDWEYEIYNFSSPSRFFGYYLDTMEKSLPKLADSMSVASNKLKEMAVKNGFDEKKIVMAHVGVNLERFSPAIEGSEIKARFNLKKNVVLYLGQLNGAQYAELAIKAFPVILKECPDTSLLIVGGGSNLEGLKKTSLSLNLEKDIVFTGFLKDEDIPKCIACSDVAVACFEKNRIAECKSPLKIGEYLGSGKAIVASDVGEVKRMVGDAGIIVNAGSTNELAQGVIKLLTDKNLRHDLEKNARIQAEKNFNWDITARNILNAYSL